MNPKVLERLESKIAEAIARGSQIRRMAELLGDSTSTYHILAGMLYNSFYYQTRRICARDPTDTEFAEFAEWLAQKRNSTKDSLVL